MNIVVVLIGEHFPSICYHDFRLRLIFFFEHVNFAYKIQYTVVFSNHSCILDDDIRL